MIVLKINYLCRREIILLSDYSLTKKVINKEWLVFFIQHGQVSPYIFIFMFISFLI